LINNGFFVGLVDFLMSCFFVEVNSRCGLVNRVLYGCVLFVCCCFVFFRWCRWKIMGLVPDVLKSLFCGYGSEANILLGLGFVLVLNIVGKGLDWFSVSVCCGFIKGCIVFFGCDVISIKNIYAYF